MEKEIFCHNKECKFYNEAQGTEGFEYPRDWKCASCEKKQMYGWKK